MTSPVRAPRPTPRGLPALPAPAPRPDLRVVRQPAPRSRAGFVFAVSALVVFGALLAVAIAHSMLVSGQAHLDQVNRELRTEQQLLQQEQLRLADNQSPDRITSEAARIGMIQSDGGNWVSPGTGATAQQVTDPPPPDADPGSTELAADTDGVTTQP